ncbi:MAG: acyltransferase domain-containing protein [Actinomycetota bacterium]|nr:acyltransferase domain-containing protein [Actinomycetota bacterium]
MGTQPPRPGPAERAAGPVLAADPTTSRWWASIADTDPVTVEPPDPLELPARLVDLAVPHEDIDAIVRAVATMAADPAYVEVLGRWCGRLHEAMEDPTVRFFDVPDLVGVLGEDHRWFHVHAYLAMLPSVARRHERLGVPADVTRRTLADLGRHLARERRRTGRGGLGTAQWLTLHQRGLIFQLGRLQFERATLFGPYARVMRSAGEDAEEGEPVLSVHIPALFGPMSPAACDASFARARAFFARHLPDERYRYVICHSWLLDGQLTRYLRPTSNIVAFRDRFEGFGPPDEAPADASVVNFVTGRDLGDVAELPRTTSLERAIADHLRTGGHWHTVLGWARWPSAAA